MGSFSLIHWIIVGIALLLLFGGNRFSSMMGDVAKGLKSFKQGMAEDDDEQRQKAEQRAREQGRLGTYDRPIDVVPNARVPDPVAPPPAAPPVPPVPPVSSTDGQQR